MKYTYVTTLGHRKAHSLRGNVRYFGNGPSRQPNSAPFTDGHARPKPTTQAALCAAVTKHCHNHRRPGHVMQPRHVRHCASLTVAGNSTKHSDAGPLTWLCGRQQHRALRLMPAQFCTKKVALTTSTGIAPRTSDPLLQTDARTECATAAGGRSALHTERWHCIDTRSLTQGV